MAAPASTGPEFGFEDHSPDASPLFFPLEWWIPIAYFVIGGLLLWRFSRTMPPRKAVTYAFVGAWLASFIGAAPVFVAALMGSASIVRTVFAIELGLSALTLLALGLCALWPRPRTRHD
jgi:hypothetical protein